MKLKQQRKKYQIIPPTLQPCCRHPLTPHRLKILSVDSLSLSPALLPQSSLSSISTRMVLPVTWPDSSLTSSLTVILSYIFQPLILMVIPWKLQLLIPNKPSIIHKHHPLSRTLSIVILSCKNPINMQMCHNLQS